MLTVPSAPAVVLDRLRKGLVPLLAELLEVADPDESIEIARPHPLYTTPLGDFAAGMLLAMNRKTSWQFIVLRDRLPFGLAEVFVELDPTGEEIFEYGGFGLGPYALSIIDAISVAEELPEVAAGDYELRILRIPTVYLVCVWLRGEAGDDILLPCHPAPPPLIPNQVTDAGGITSALHALALHRLEIGKSDV